jgi:hypothetical protein
VQGRLRNAYLTVTISTHCSYSGDPLQIEIDSQLKYRVQPEAVGQIARQISQPMVFTPQVDWQAFHDPNIIDAY